MSRFELLHDTKRALERAVDLDDLVPALFADHPELQSFSVDVTNEYDDNNYSDYSRVTRVNGWSVDYDGEYDGFAEEEEISTPKASSAAINNVMSIAEYVQDKYGYGEHNFERSIYEGRVQKSVRTPNSICAMALLNGDRVCVDVLLEACDRWTLHHADAHGRYDEADEFALFAREDAMGLALEYAKKFGPLSDKTLNYFVLSLKADDYGHEHLQEYLEWAKEKAA
jgi:hypothetical protein